MGKIKRKALNFDLDTKALKKYYPGKRYRQAYRDLKSFLLNNGFTHRQWSGYNSKEPMTDSEVRAVVSKLKTAFPWIKKCARRFDVTNIGKQHNLIPFIRSTEKVNAKEIKEEPIQQKNQSFFTVQKLRAEAKRIHSQPKNNSVTKKHENEL